MKPGLLTICLSLLLICSLGAAARAQAGAKTSATPATFAATQPKSTSPTLEQKRVIEQARRAYYGLRALGLDEFQAAVKPNWEIVLKGQLKADPVAGERGLKVLNGLHFSMVLDKDGKVTLTHHTDAEPANEQQRKGFDEIYSGMDQAIDGFFATWSLFMLNSPLPATESAYKLDDLGSEYRLSYKDGDSDVVTQMGKDFIISDLRVKSPQFTSSVRPQFTHTEQGLVLSGYAADYVPTSGPGVIKLDVKIDHQPVSGLQLPVTLKVDSVYDGAPTHIELAFSGHQVKWHKEIQLGQQSGKN